jgi:peptidoglycan hydrolase-like protein with peptidoglycan-binding domain
MNPKITSSVTASMLALAVLTTALPAPVAHAQSNTDLQTQIAALLAQISQLQSQLGNGSSMQSYTFVRNLKIGDTGEDVRMLQRLLNQSADTQVSLSGAGSVGNETTYFGPATAAAVSKFQVKYRADILAPAGLQNPTGFFGPSSIKKANALSSAVVVTPPVVKPTKPTTPDKPVVENEGTILKGNGDLKTFEIDSVSDSDIHEAAADAEIAELTFESKNGDLELSRMDIALVADSGNDERDPWDVFETISLWVD